MGAQKSSCDDINIINLFEVAVSNSIIYIVFKIVFEMLSKEYTDQNKDVRKTFHHSKSQKLSCILHNNHAWIIKNQQL